MHSSAYFVFVPSTLNDRHLPCGKPSRLTLSLLPTNMFCSQVLAIISYHSFSHYVAAPLSIPLFLLGNCSLDAGVIYRPKTSPKSHLQLQGTESILCSLSPTFSFFVLQLHYYTFLFHNHSRWCFAEITLEVLPGAWYSNNGVLLLPVALTLIHRYWFSFPYFRTHEVR